MQVVKTFSRKIIELYSSWVLPEMLNLMLTDDISAVSFALSSSAHLNKAA